MVMLGEDPMVNIVFMLILSMPLLIFASNVDARDLGNYGQTFEIKEEDVIEYIKRRLKELEASGELAKHQALITEKAKEKLKRPTPVLGIKHTETERHFIYDPTYTVKEDIKDHQGNIVFRQGTTINPLDTVSWGNDMLFIDGDDEEHVAWAINHSSSRGEKDLDSKVIVLVKGEPITLEEKLDAKIYFDQEGKITTQLGITQIPAVARQQGNLLSIREVELVMDGVRK